MCAPAPPKPTPPRETSAGTTGTNVSTAISNAFLQTTPFPDTDRRFLMIRSPIDGTVTYYRQLISVYGSCSAPARWETTFSTWLTSPESAGGPGLVRGMNEPSDFHLLPLTIASYAMTVSAVHTAEKCLEARALARAPHTRARSRAEYTASLKSRAS